MRTLLLTGSSGFLGKSILPHLLNEFDITTLGNTESDSINTDLSRSIPIIIERFDVVIHAAGKAHSIPKNQNEAKLFFDVNTNGTKNLCAGLENNLPKSFIFISTVAVYGVEAGENIEESHSLNGSTPYALSKIEAESFLTEWCLSKGIVLSILRPSLIAGFNPPGNLGAMIKGIKSGRYLRIGDATTRRSILMAEDIAHLVPYLINCGGIFNVCDNHNPSFFELESLITKQLNLRSPKRIPLWLAQILAKVGDVMGDFAPINSHRLEKLTQNLTFSNAKAKRELNWEPKDVLLNFIVK